MFEPGCAPLLATKLYVPRPRRTLISREHLLCRLDEGLARSLTLLVAPPGFGKSTLLAQWLASRGQPAAWLSLDAADNDPARFWTYVIVALETLHPGIGDDVRALCEASQMEPIEPVLTALINAVAACPADFSLVLDDYHVIENDRIHQALAFLLGHTPAPMHLTISTRADPLLPLARLRASDDLVELRAGDLRFNTEEVSRFLISVMQLPVSQTDVSALESCTEGWIAGLQLAALALRGQDAAQIPDFIAASATSNRFVIDYLVEEVLQREDESVQTFLCQTACLDRLSAPICNAVTGRSDSRAMLDYLERTNHFLIPLDLEHTWYRYHNLFGDVLRKLLSQRQPEAAPELHRRASKWYETHGFAHEAAAHALAVAPAPAGRTATQPGTGLHPVEPLSQRELEVLRLVAAGLGNREIAERLVLSLGTIKSHMHSICGKLGVQDRNQALVQAQALQLL